MKFFCLLFALLASIYTRVEAQKDSRFVASVSSDSVFMGHYFKLTFTLENAKGSRFTPPEFDPDMEIVSGPNTASSFSMVHGETTQKLSYSYLVRPEVIGVLTIMSASIETEDGILETDPIQLRVLPNDEGVRQPAVDRSTELFRMDFGKALEGFPMPRTTPEESPSKKRKVVKM